VGHFIASMWSELLSEQFICQDSRLGESVDCFADFKVYESVQCMSVEVILFDGFLGKKVDGHFHLFQVVHGHPKVEIFNVKADIPGIGSADDAVP
jgi:hypothetical protein